MLRKLLVFIGVLCCVSTLASEAKQKSFWVFEDKSNANSIQDVLSQATFTPRNNLNFGYISHSVWIKIPLDSFPIKENSKVVLSHSALYYVDFFLVEQGRVIKQKHTGLKQKVATRGEWTNKFYLDLPPGPCSHCCVYIRLLNEESALKTSVSIVNPASNPLPLHFEILVFVAIGSLVLVLVLYNLLSYYKFPKTIFLFYAAYILFFFLHIGANMGMFHLVFPDLLLPYSTFIRVFWSIPTLGFFMLFVYQLLDLDTIPLLNLRKFFSIAQALLLFFLVVILVPKNAQQLQLSAAAFYLYYSLVFILLVYTGLVSFRQGHKPAYYFLLGQFPLMAVFILVLLRNYHILPFIPLMNFLPESLFVLELVVTFICLELHIKSEKRIEALVLNQVDQQTLVSAYAEELKLANEMVDPEVQEHFDKLVAFVKKRKPFLLPELKIADLAVDLNLSSHQLSKAINTCSGMHFFDFINSYRIEYAKTRMSDPEVLKKFTIESIAKESGFNNKTSFNASFKKFTGKTPTEFKMQILG